MEKTADVFLVLFVNVVHIGIRELLQPITRTERIRARLSLWKPASGIVS